MPALYSAFSKDVDLFTEKVVSLIIKKLIKFIGGGEILDINTFVKTLRPEQIKQIEIARDSSKNDSLENIKQNYITKSTLQLYDFIYDNQNNTKLIKIWDHERNNPGSITAGLPGVHVYVIIENSKIPQIFEIIGKFIRS